MDFSKQMLSPWQKAYDIARQAYGTAIAAMAEKIYILETANYTSTQFQNGYSAGMVASTPSYPYGWTSLDANLWSKRIGTKPWGVWTTNVPNQGTFSYVKFPTFTVALVALCQRLSEIGNDPTKWNGGADPDYATKIAAMTNEYVI